MKGIILAGGRGTRLYPATLAVNKQLLPIYDKPMIFYPLSVLMLAGIREILIVSSPDHIDTYRELFGDGSSLGLDMNYVVQPEPAGLPQAFTLGEAFIGDDNVCLILGDNILYGASLSEMLLRASSREDGATVFACRVTDPERYGVIELDERSEPVALEEKPQAPRSDLAVTGLYFFDTDVVRRTRDLRPSRRGELEITDLIRSYLDEGRLSVEQLGRGFAWLDAGTHDSLLEAGEFVRTIQHRQGIMIACLEEIAFDRGWISTDTMRAAAAFYGDTDYGRTIAQCIGD